jgi:hypothetical protein
MRYAAIAFSSGRITIVGSERLGYAKLLSIYRTLILIIIRRSSSLCVLKVKTNESPTLTAVLWKARVL